MQEEIKESGTFIIPIEEFEKDINSDDVKEYKNEIIDIFKNHNQLRSEEEFKEIKINLHDTCKNCDLKLIKIFLSETINNKSNDLVFKIDRVNQTASLFKVNNNIEHLIIPRSVEHESKDYLITSIISIGNSYVKTVNFVEDSAVTTIYRNAFFNSNIEEIYLPASLKELKKGWHFGALFIKKIEISPSNDQFAFKDNKFLVGKSDPKSDEFDIILFVRRDIEEISIPSNIKIISSSAFFYFEYLRKVKIQSNSNLQVIESDAFSGSKIEEIFIPSTVSKICKNAFDECTNLRKIEFQSNSNLQIIESYAFSGSKIEEIFIPSTVLKISNGMFSLCENLRKIEIPKNSSLKTIESNAFFNSKIEEIYFPSNLIELKEGWFLGAKQLKKIIISPSNGQFIFKDDKYLIGKSDPKSDKFDNFLYARYDIEEASVPSNIKIISSNAFCLCKNLRKIDIPKNSNLQTIESCAFFDTKIEEIYFPSNLIELKKEWCLKTNQLKKIIISPSNGQFIFKDDKYLIGKSDPKSDEFDNLLFARRDIEEASIPSNIKIISSNAFSLCNNLRKVEFLPNSSLKIIGSNAFFDSKIEKIFIPSKVIQICNGAFFDCKRLRKVEIPTDSNLQTIELSAFAYSNITNFFITSKITNINTTIFNGCWHLQIIEISEESQLESLSTFYNCTRIIVMIPSSLKNLTILNKSI